MEKQFVSRCGGLKTLQNRCALYFFFFAVPFSLEDFASPDDFDSFAFESAVFDSAGFESEDWSGDFAALPSPEPSTDVAPEFLPL
jgi:hypothetical protein